MVPKAELLQKFHWKLGCKDMGALRCWGFVWGGGIYETPTAANGIYAPPELNIYYYSVTPGGGIPSRPKNKNYLLGFYGGWGLARPP